MAKIIDGPQILIESDGMGRTTKVTHVPSGIDLSNCLKGVTWSIDGKGGADISLHLVGPLVRTEVKGILENLKVDSLEEWQEMQKAATGRYAIPCASTSRLPVKEIENG